MNNLEETEEDRRINEVRKSLGKGVIKPIIEQVKESYGRNLTPMEKKRLESSIQKAA